MACMLGAMLTKDEVDEFMREADVVRQSLLKVFKFFEINIQRVSLQKCILSDCSLSMLDRLMKMFTKLLMFNVRNIDQNEHRLHL